MKAVAPVPKPVTLVAVKENPKLDAMMLVNNSRLSVQPVTADEWAEVCRMGGLDAAKFKSSAKAGGAADERRTQSRPKKTAPAKKAAKSARA